MRSGSDISSHVDHADVRSVRRWPAAAGEHAAIDVSILIPCYRAEDHIGHALASIEDQAGLAPDLTIETVIVIDGRRSDADAVYRLIDDHQQRYWFSIVVIELHRNLGAGLARCHGWERCRGELVAFLDDDDTWRSDKLALQLRLHADHPDQIATGHLYGAISPDRIDPDGQPAAVPVRPVHFRQLLTRTRLATPTLMIRRRLWPDGPEPYRFGEDTLMKLTIASTQPILELQAALAGPSPWAPAILADDDSLTRQRWRSRCSQWRNYALLVRRGRLSGWLFLPLVGISALLLVRRLMLDLLEKARHPGKTARLRNRTAIEGHESAAASHDAPIAQDPFAEHGHE